MRTTKRSFLSLSLGGMMVAGSFSGLEAAKLSDVVNNATIDGFAFGRIHSLHGKGGDGTRFQLRFKPTITTGEVAGFSASAGIFFSKGSGTPDGHSLEHDFSGSRGDTISSLVDRFNIGDFYVTYKAHETLGSKTTFRLGQKTPGTVFNDNNLDRAMGVFIENSDIDALNVGFQFWDAWMGDDIYISFPSINEKGAGIGNNMFLAYAKSSANFTKDTGLAYNLWYGGIHRWVDAMIFGDVSYTANFDNQSLSLLGQVAFTRLANDIFIYAGSSKGAGANNMRTLYDNAQYDYAKNRGVYNIRLDYKYKFVADSIDGEEVKPVGHFGVAAGFTGSFGKGFGALIDNTGGLKLGGHLWNGFSGAEANGFGILGVGGFNNSSIMVPYAKVDFGYKKFGTALDLAYVDASHFFYLKKGSPTGGENLNKVPSMLYDSYNHIKAAKFFEAALSATYKFTDNINVFTSYAYAFGDLNFGRFRFQVNYVF